MVVLFFEAFTRAYPGKLTPTHTTQQLQVSRRLQFYLEEQLQRYYLINQHLVSIQPMDTFGEYETRNKLALPKRLDKT